MSMPQGRECVKSRSLEKANLLVLPAVGRGKLRRPVAATAVGRPLQIAGYDLKSSALLAGSTQFGAQIIY